MRLYTPQVSRAQKARQSKAEDEAAAQNKLPPIRKDTAALHYTTLPYPILFLLLCYIRLLPI